MGGRGTDVARESAGLVLLDDDFSSIVAAFRLGEKNLRQPAEGRGLHLLRPPAYRRDVPPSVLFGWPPALLPVRIMFLELIIIPSSSRWRKKKKTS